MKSGATHSNPAFALATNVSALPEDCLACLPCVGGLELYTVLFLFVSKPLKVKGFSPGGICRGGGFMAGPCRKHYGRPWPHATSFPGHGAGDLPPQLFICEV